MKRKIFLTGANGLLGQHLLTVLNASAYEVFATGKGEARLTPGHWQYFPLDITDGIATSALIARIQPDVVIHAAAITQVDFAEQHPIDCWNTNVTATRFLLEAAAKCQAHFIHISSDFVFSGEDGPYHEASVPAPVNYYGSSKLTAEKAVMDYPGTWSIVRTVLVLGEALSGTRATLASWVKSSLKEGKKINVVSDQRRTPTAVTDLANGILRIVEKKAAGIYHLSGKTALSPYEIAVKIAEKNGYDPGLITPVTEKEFSQPAKRPRETIFIVEKAERELGFVVGELPL